MSAEQNGIGSHEHGVVMTVPDVPATMEATDTRSGEHATPAQKKGCLGSLCSCFSAPSEPAVPAVQKRGQQQVLQDQTKRGELSPVPPPHQADLSNPQQEPAPQPPQTSTLPALESMNASSGDLVIPDNRRGSSTWSIPDKGEANGKDHVAASANLDDVGRKAEPIVFETSKNSGINNHSDRIADASTEESRLLESSYSYAGSAAALDDVEMTGLQPAASRGGRWADLQGYVEVEDHLNSARMSEGDTVQTSPEFPASSAAASTADARPSAHPLVPALAGMPVRKRSASPAGHASLPMSKTPMMTPRGNTPRERSPHHSPRESLAQVGGQPDPQTEVLGVDGQAVDCRAVEQVVLSGIDAVAQCMLVSHWTAPDVGCLLTLKSAPGSAGVALDHAGLQLASRSGSEAATVMSARQCALFRRGLAQALEHVNHRIARAGVTVKRFQVLREELSTANGMLTPGGELRRGRVLERYRHIVDDMYQHEGIYPHKWMENLRPPDGEARGGAGKVVLHSGGSPPLQARDVREYVELGGGGALREQEGGRWEGRGREGEGGGGGGGGGWGKQGAMRPGEGREGGEGAPGQGEIVAYLSQLAEMRARTEAEGRGGGGYNSYNNFGGGWTQGRAHGGVPGRGGGSGQSSPRFGFGGASNISPRLTHRSGGSQQQRLPHSVRMLSVESPGSGNNTPRDRGRYSPSFASGGVQPFTKAVNPSIIPVGSGPLGLPVGGANFDGAFRSCVTGAPPLPLGKPPRPQPTAPGLSKRTEAASLDAIAGRPPVPRPVAFAGGQGHGGAGDGLGVRREEASGGIQVGPGGAFEVVQTPTGEWAF